MCRLFAITSEDPLSPMVAMNALNVMREGHDGSGVGLFLRDLGGPFEEMKDAPILSGIFSDDGLKRLQVVRQPRHRLLQVLDPDADRRVRLERHIAGQHLEQHHRIHCRTTVVGAIEILDLVTDKLKVDHFVDFAQQMILRHQFFNADEFHTGLLIVMFS